MDELLSPTTAAGPWVACPKCQAQVPCLDPARSRYFGCYRCRTFFQANPLNARQPAEQLDGFKKALLPGPALPLGAVAELGGYRCRVTGYQVRGEQQDRTAEWREYQLRPATPTWVGDDPIDLPLQLAEYNGHWLLIRRAPFHPEVKGKNQFNDHSWTHEATGQEFRLWHRYHPVIRDAQGEFDWNILEDEGLKIQEFIAPPQQLVSEKRKGGETAWYLAEHIEAYKVGHAFGLPPGSLPAQLGTGATEPNPIPGWPQLKRLSLGAVLLLVALQVLLAVLRPSTMVLVQDFTLSETPSPAGGTSQMQTSRSFELHGPTALDVDLQIPFLDNHWAEVTASLVNEQTGQGYEFTRSVEYYRGYEGGENWSEGSHDASATLHALPSGRYHFNLYPSLDAGAGTGTLTLTAEENPLLLSNFWLALLVLAAVPALLGWLYYNYESNRWQNSNFNPYPSSGD